jgi:hypothetical protein
VYELEDPIEPFECLWKRSDIQDYHLEEVVEDRVKAYLEFERKFKHQLDTNCEDIITLNISFRFGY